MAGVNHSLAEPATSRSNVLAIVPQRRSSVQGKLPGRGMKVRCDTPPPPPPSTPPPGQHSREASSPGALAARHGSPGARGHAILVLERLLCSMDQWTQKRTLRGTAHCVHCVHAEANDLLGRAGEVAEAILKVDPEIVSLQDPRQWQRQDAEKERARFKLAGAVERMG